MSPDIYAIIVVGQKHILPQFWLKELQNLELLACSILVNTDFKNKCYSIDFKNSCILKLDYQDQESVPVFKYVFVGLNYPQSILQSTKDLNFAFLL